jgi:rhamnose transport system ATP-binding protein
MDAAPVLVAATGLRKAFAGVQALSGLSLTLRGGDVHALVGENGAGKSTFVRILTGIEVPDEGTLEIGRTRVAGLTPALAKALGVAAIQQHPALFPHLSVAENISLPLERGGLLARVDWAARDRRARQLLARVGAAIAPNRTVETLSLPEQQLVEIAKALGASARVLLMDEPTASLTARDVDLLFDVVRRLRSDGVGIIYISHRLEEIGRIADRVTVIRDGATVATDLRPDVDHRHLVRLMVGRTVDQSTRRNVFAGADAPVVLELDRVSSRAAGVQDVSFVVRRGEIVGLAGLVGAGRTQLAEAIFGLRPVDAGTIRLRGQSVRFTDPAAAIAAGVAYVPEDRRKHGVLAPMTVAENASLASLNQISRAGLIDRPAEALVARRFVERFRIKTPSIHAPVGSLSGGNQQKVALARWLATSPVLLILDEPTQGVDVGAKSEIHALIKTLADDGLAVLLISSDLPEVMALSNRIVVMHRGGVSGTIDAVGATEEAVAALAIAPPTHTATEAGV